MIKINLYYSTNDYKNEVMSDEYNEIIDYNFIMNKLTKNDIYKLVPSSTVISVYIHKRLCKIFNEKKDYNILYIIKSLNKETIDNIYHVIEELARDHECDYQLDLTLRNISSFNNNVCKDTISHITYL